jgi:hypothetical protein
MVLLYRCEKGKFRFWSACPPEYCFDEHLLKAKTFSDYPTEAGLFEGEFFTNDDVEWINGQLEGVCYEEI